MHPRPILHWKSLWFGILVLAFITWAWRRSSTHSDKLSFTRSTTTYTVESEGSMLLFTVLPFHPTLTPPGWEFHSETLWDSDLSYFKPAFIQIHDGFIHFYWLAWWIPALSFLLPWATFLAWRWHRMKRLAAALPKP